MSKPRWIYIAGQGRSGTTLLGSLLADALEAFDCGELHLLWESLVSGRLCSCGTDVARCPLWSEVATRVRAELDLGTNEDGAAIMRHRLRQRQLMVPRLPSPHRDELALRRATEEAIKAVTDAPVFVDSSKLSSVLWTAASLDRPLEVVHLVRDPRAVAFSWSRPTSDPSLHGQDMHTKNAARAAFDWQRGNLTTLRVLRHVPAVERVVVRYEDLTSRPEEVLRSLTGHTMTDLVAFSKDTAAKSHALAGNPKRYVSNQAIRPDVRWRENIGTVDRVVATSLTWPLLRRFGYTVRAR